jgi:hypothetical protein
VPNVDTGRAPSKQQRRTVTKDDQLRIILLKIDQTLMRYEQDDIIDSWKLSFNPALDYDSSSVGIIKDYHKQLVASSFTCDKVKLLTFFERGRLYDYIKFSGRLEGSWRDGCRNLFGICCKTVDRYIEFMKIINAYPRLLVCELSFETIMVHYNELRQHLAIDETLANRLQQPLRMTRISGELFTPQKLKPGGGNPPG